MFAAAAFADAAVRLGGDMKGLLRRLGLMSLIACTLALGGCSGLDLCSDEGTAPRPAGVPVEYDRDYADDFASLVRESKVIAIGCFTGVRTEVSRSSDGSFVHMAAAFVVEQTVWGEGSTASEVVRSFSAGEPVFGAGSEPLIDGKRYLVFLQGDGAVLVTVGGEQGVFAVEQSVLRSLDLRLPGTGALHGRTVDEAEAVIAIALGA